MRLTGLVAIVVVLLAAGPARASTVAIDVVEYCSDSQACKYHADFLGSALRVTGEGSEANRVAVRRSGGTLVVSDDGAVLHPAGGCVAVTAHLAHCVPGENPLVGASLDGGDGDDVLSVDGDLEATAAEDQRFVLTGGAGDDVVDGGDQDETLAGGPGSDVLRGRAGDDRFAEAPSFPGGDGSEADTLDGGPGTDTADYSGRGAALAIHLGRGGGARGERDRVTGVERLTGGDGDDTLSGDGRANLIAGGRGDDRISGGDGSDILVGGRGSDRLDGGAGRDRLGVGDDVLQPAGRGDRARCGSGHDLVGERFTDALDVSEWRGPDSDDVVGTDCEEVVVPDRPSVGYGLPGFRARPLRTTESAWTFASPCVARRCHVRIALGVRDGSRVAHARFTGPGPIRLAFGPRTARRLLRAQAITVRVVITQRGVPRRSTAFLLPTQGAG